MSGADAKPANAKTVSVTKEIARLELEARNPRDAALERLRRFVVVEDFQVGGSERVRVAPHMIARLYCSGHTAVREMEEFIKSRGFEKCHSAQELAMLGLLLDKLIVLEQKATW